MIHGERMCGVKFKDVKGSPDLMFVLGLNEAIDQLAMAYIVCLIWSYVEERGW